MKWALSILLFSYCFFWALEGSEVSEKTPQVILITGASRGIGWETAKKLALEGHHVYASMRSLQTFPQDRTNWPLTLYLLELDVTDESTIYKALEEIHQKEGRLDVLINNAGCAVFGPLEMVTMDQAKNIFEVNFFGPMRLMQAVLPIMRKQNKGLIVNLSSLSGIRPSPGWDLYGASKFAIEGLSEATAAMAREWNVDIVVVEPGTTATHFIEKSTEIGNRWTSETCVYEHFMLNAFQWMQERLATGQDPEEVAELIGSLVASEQRHFRYQTSLKGKQIVANRHCDPTGEQSIQEQGALIKQLWQGPLEAQIGNSCR